MLCPSKATPNPPRVHDLQLPICNCIGQAIISGKERLRARFYRAGDGHAACGGGPDCTTRRGDWGRVRDASRGLRSKVATYRWSG